MLIKVRPAALESSLVGGAKHLRFSSQMCIETVRGLDSLEGCRDKEKAFCA